MVLVAHSWGGYPVNGAAGRLAGRLAGLVYYSAQVPVPGRSLVNDNPPEAAALLRTMIESSPTRSISPALQFVEQVFMQDHAPDVTTLGLPLRYLLGDQDRALPHPGLVFAARLGLIPTSVPGTQRACSRTPTRSRRRSWRRPGRGQLNAAA
ncbi:alpha/beta fold hydrolase [Streptomyces liangshanensis]|uniref:Alpha/beta hydrolase n=1 Tax=Streptomyces liangshanensis TaxID=2717324 RepID=A0A6G9H0S3_9ACTN|nr:hypothetical protein [Streptomyces liangshanensis]QIQ04142.1 hypothetical protein HA039_19150 [Streptomyces liangshanensis]